MINGSASVQWIDVISQENGISSIAKLFQKYSLKAKRVSDDVELVEFDESDNVKVTDWTGWTNVRYIRKVRNNDNFWKIIKAGNQALMVSSDTKIPVYDEFPIQGFHGETKYPYTVKEIKNLTTEDFVRVLNPNVTFLRHNDLYHIEVNSHDIHDDNAWGFEIITRSNFFNANKFHLYGSDTIPANIKYK